MVLKIFRVTILVSWLVVAFISALVGNIDKAIYAMLLAILMQLNIIDSKESK